MNELIGYLLTCGPFVLIFAAWVRVYRARQQAWPRPIALAALGITTANAALAAGEYLRLQFRTAVWLPTWKDPQILTLGMLFFLAPIGTIVGFLALARGAPKWLVCVVEIASLPLLVIGFFAAVSV